MDELAEDHVGPVSQREDSTEDPDFLWFPELRYKSINYPSTTSLPANRGPPSTLYYGLSTH